MLMVDNGYRDDIVN